MAGKVSEVVTPYLCLTHSFACSQPGQSLFHFNTEVNRWRHPRVEWIAPFYITHFTGKGGGVGAESKDITLKNRWVVKLSAVALWANGIYCMPWLNAERTAVLLFFYCLWCLWLSLAQCLFETRWRPMFLSPQCFADYREEWKVLMCQTPGLHIVVQVCFGEMGNWYKDNSCWHFQAQSLAHTLTHDITRLSIASGSAGARCLCHLEHSGQLSAGCYVQPDAAQYLWTMNMPRSSRGL